MAEHQLPAVYLPAPRWRGLLRDVSEGTRDAGEWDTAVMLPCHGTSVSEPGGCKCGVSGPGEQGAEVGRNPLKC